MRFSLLFTERLDRTLKPFFAVASFKNPKSDASKWLTGAELGARYAAITEKYAMVMIEDPFAEDDWESWAPLTATTPIEITGGAKTLPDGLVVSSLTRDS